MAVPSFINAPRIEGHITPHKKSPLPELQQSPESWKLGSLPQIEATSLATLTRVAQFLAHDLRHHLSTVCANAEFLGNGNIQPIEMDELLEEIRFAVSCMTDQLDSLLLCTRTGHTSQPRRESLKVILGRAVQMVRSHPDTRNISITQREIPVLDGWLDGMKLSSAVFNLVLNACQATKAASEEKEVAISLHQDSSHVLIRVSDNGPGISDAVRETLFQPFMKAAGARGMGLGLTIARCIAREHGGEVYLEATCPGNTVFVMTLPVSLFRGFSSSRP